MRDFPPLIAQLFYNRDITEPAQAQAFFVADEQLQGAPLLLPDMAKAVARIYRALLSGENIAIYGDFDADGVCATALLSEGIALLGGKVVPYIPHRSKDSRGLSCSGLDDLHQQGITLVITVDCGITAAPEVEYARRKGTDVIITDHHQPLPSLPPAVAVVNPKRSGSAYPFPSLAGVGVAFKLLQALFQALGKEEGLEDVLDLVALGTVADVMPLLAENRYLVRKGLQVLNKTRRLGLQEIVRLAGLRLGDLDEESISWNLGPRLNAAGRIDHGLTSYRLLVTKAPEEAFSLAQELERLNVERQRLTAEVLRRIKRQLTPEDIHAPLIMVGGEGFSPGVIGLAASRLANEFNRPAIVLTLDEDSCQGSARSIPEFDIVAALEKCHHLLVRFGGHPMAAGFVVSSSNLPHLKQCLLQAAGSQLSGLDLQTVLPIDSEVPLSELKGTTFKYVQEFAPFGEGNPVPVFLSRGVKVIDYRCVGANQGHLKLKLRQNGVLWNAIGFDLGARLPELTANLDVVYTLGVNRWGGNELLELNILDFAPAKSA